MNLPPVLCIILVFCASFILEALSTLFTIAVRNDDENIATVISALIEAFGWLMLAIIVQEPTYIIPSVIGNMLGTKSAFRIAKFFAKRGKFDASIYHQTRASLQ